MKISLNIYKIKQNKKQGTLLKNFEFPVGQQVLINVRQGGIKVIILCHPGFGKTNSPEKAGFAY